MINRGKLLVFFDSKKILLAARLFFAVGSALAATAPSMNAFILGKAITGVGGSGTYLSIINIFTALTAAEERARCFSYIGFMWGLGTINVTSSIGPVIGGAFAATAAGWRWSFYFNLILPWFVTGSSLALIMSVCLYTTEIDTSHAKIYGYLILGGVGTGLYAMNAAPVMSAIVAKGNTAAASTIFGCVDIISSSFSVGIANSIFVNRASDSIQKILPATPRATVREAITGVGGSLTDQLPPPVKAAVLQAVLNAIKDAWIQMIATAALSLALSCFLRSRKLSHLPK
ncbi:MAG: hypothetical protein Q9191_001062 [Dirinaria sp. TL-2023a]